MAEPSRQIITDIDLRVAALEQQLKALQETSEMNSASIKEFGQSRVWIVNRITDLYTYKITYWQIVVIALALIFIYAMIDQSLLAMILEGKE